MKNILILVSISNLNEAYPKCQKSNLLESQNLGIIQMDFSKNKNLFKQNSVDIFMENPRKETRLEKIARHITNPSTSRTGRTLWFIPAVYLGGEARAKYQESFANAIRVKPHNLTILNAAIFGVGGAIFYHFGGQEASKLMENVAKEFSQPTEVVADVLAGYTLINSIFRLGYSFKTKKAIGSPCLVGLVSTISCASAEYGSEMLDKIKKDNGVNN